MLAKTRPLPAPLIAVAIAIAHPLLSLPVLRLLSVEGVALIWPASGFALALLILYGNRMIPPLLAGTIFTECVLGGHSLPAGLLVASGSVLATWAGSLMLTQDRGFQRTLNSSRDQQRLVVIGGAVALTSALSGVGGLIAGGELQTAMALQSAIFWTMGDWLGIAIFTPIFLLWHDSPHRWHSGSRPWVTLLLLSVTCVIAGLVFLDRDTKAVSWLDYPFLIFIPVILAAVRLGRRGVLSLVAVVAAFAIWGTAHGSGPFGDEGKPQGLIDLWGFIATLTVVGTVVASLLRDRDVALLGMEQRTRELRRAQGLAKLGKWTMTLDDGRQSWSEEIYKAFGIDPTWPAPTLAEVGELCTAQSRAELAEHFSALRETGLPFGVDACILRPDGEQRWIRITAEASRNALGEPDSAFGTVQDITERKASEESLQALADELESHREALEAEVAERTRDLRDANTRLAERARRIEELYDGAPCGYHTIDLNGRIIEANRTALEMVGRSRDEVIGRQAEEFLTPASRARFARNFESLIETGSARSLEYDLLAGNGSTLPVLLDSRLVRDADGVPLLARCTMIDNRERKAREQQIVAMQLELARRADAAEAANRAKSAFLANMSHEIRTPMNAVIGFAHMLRPSLADPRQADKVDKIIRSGRHLLDIINDILDLSKIEAGQVELENLGFRIAPVVDDAAGMFRDRMESKGLAFRTEIDPSLERIGVTGDPLRVQQILINYLSNAYKFTEAGEVSVRVRRLGTGAAGERIRFEVTDTGIGIDQGLAERLFRPFEQAESSTARRFGGTGLGLAISRRLARLMGGETGLDSQPGAGSTFWFEASFPLLEVTPGEGIIAPRARIRTGARVLVVEDNEINQEVARDVLMGLGLNVTLACNGREAVDLASPGAFDLVLMDLQMPEMDGLQATRLMRAMPGLGDLPIVAMTANAFDEDRERCREAGMSDFVAKPVDPEGLRNTLSRWLPARRET